MNVHLANHPNVSPKLHIHFTICKTENAFKISWPASKECGTFEFVAWYFYATFVAVFHIWNYYLFMELKHASYIENA